eukprot:2351655-Pyramimonas_sp.AAC.1
MIDTAVDENTAKIIVINKIMPLVCKSVYDSSNAKLFQVASTLHQEISLAPNRDAHANYLSNLSMKAQKLAELWPDYKALESFLSLRTCFMYIAL